MILGLICYIDCGASFNYKHTHSTLSDPDIRGTWSSIKWLTTYAGYSSTPGNGQVVEDEEDQPLGRAEGEEKFVFLGTFLFNFAFVAEKKLSFFV